MAERFCNIHPKKENENGKENEEIHSPFPPQAVLLSC